MNEYQKRFIHTEKPMLSDEEHIEEGLMEWYDRYFEYDHPYMQRWAENNGAYFEDIYSKDYIEYEPYLSIMNEFGFFDNEHNSKYKLKEAC